MNSRTPESRSRSSSRRHDRSRDRAHDQLSREERKEATRRAIVSAALHLLAEHSFSGLSLREVTREAGISPAAFYRHFESMEALGLVLIDESFRSLRDMLRGARAGKLDPTRVIEREIRPETTRPASSIERYDLPPPPKPKISVQFCCQCNITYVILLEPPLLSSPH